jgi:hypothetical protein
MFLLLLGVGGCQKDEFTTEPSQQKPYFSTQKIDYNTVIGTFKDPNLVDFLKNQESKMRFEDASKSKNTLFFNKISKGNLYDSYTLQINNFSKESPYFKFFVLTKKGAEEKAGFVKYIPAKLNPFLDVKRFTGVLEMYDINNNLYATTGFKNGIPNTQEKSNLQAKNCVNLIRIIEHKCSNGGDHAPGEYCDAGLINDAYYEVRVTVLCDPKVSYTAPPDYFITNPVGGGGTNILDIERDYEQSFSNFLDALSYQQKEIARNNQEIKNYLFNNNFSEESLKFALEGIDFLIENPTVDWEKFMIFYENVPKWYFNKDDGSTFQDLEPLKQPDFRFDPSDNYESLYPKFTNMIKNLKTFVKNNPKVLNALQAYSGFTKQEILNKLTYGKGPTIKIADMTGKYGYYSPYSKVLNIRASYIRGLEQSSLQSTQEATSFLLAVTVLHEFVHYGTAHNEISEGMYDFGLGFERDAFNVIVSKDNAGEVVMSFTKYF